MTLPNAASLVQAAWFAAAIVLFLVLTARGRMQPFLALVLAGVAFGIGVGLATSQIGRAFGTGFGQAIGGLGLVVVGAAMMAELADLSGASARLAVRARGWRRRWPLFWLGGLIAGTAASAPAAFAVLGPLRRALGGGPRAALRLALAISAGHGLLLPAPLVIAAVTILAADWRIALGLGLPAALVAGAAGALFVGRAPRASEAPGEPPGEVFAAPGRGAAALVVASVVLIALLVAQSLGDIASEPFGGGSNREFLLALGRPLVLMLAGLAVLLVLSGRWPLPDCGEAGWPGRAVGKSAGLLLLVGAAGGLQKLAQETGMAEMNAERLLAWPALGLVLPFALAAIGKALQGSSLVAAITAAGMVQPLLAPLGLDDPAGRALAALAVSAGAMSLSHLNDALFWLTGEAARLRPAGALRHFTLGTLVQGLAALGVLYLLRLATV
ncbi:MAG TPA: GntP family permease [Xanthobacteraceae bacterium]|nr:GntP family permease [Xanthobacteraceae bacterium]